MDKGKQLEFFATAIPVNATQDATPAPYEIHFELKTFCVREPQGAANRWTPGAALTDPAALAKVARAIFATLDTDKEHFVLIAANQKNKITGAKVISTGTLTASLVHPREVMRAALFFNAAAIAFVHNHPAGDPAPSVEDSAITRRLKECADIFGIRVLDHVILGDETFFSYSNKGLL